MLRRISPLWALLFAGLLLLGVIIAVFVHDAQTPVTPVALPLTQTFDQSPTGFTLKYPDDWSYSIPTIGVFVLAPSQTLNGSEAGPSFTVQRAEPLSISGTLDAALDRYLHNGPLRSAGRWQITEPIQTTRFEGRDARLVALEGADLPGTPPLHTQIIATVADDSLIYFLTTAVPVSKQAAFQPTFDAMLKTVQILE